MKTCSVLLLSAVLVCSLNDAGAAIPASYSPMKIIQTEGVVYPEEAIQLGIISGQVTVAIQIDETGLLTDHLVVGYTHPKFAERAVAALKKWKYEPAYIEGAARAATAELSFNFEAQGVVVVNLTVNTYMDMRSYQLRPSSFSYRACRLSELDRIPTPSKVVAPVNLLDPTSADQPVTVTVHFYIDEQGHVRLPAVSRESTLRSERLAAAALDAVSHWEFEPPLSHGQPVLVSARQDFNFMPPPKKESPTASK